MNKKTYDVYDPLLTKISMKYGGFQQGIGKLEQKWCYCKEPKNYYCYKCGKPCCDCQLYGYMCEECCNG